MQGAGNKKEKDDNLEGGAFLSLSASGGLAKPYFPFGISET
jgi:hypothetical protein